MQHFKIRGILFLIVSGLSLNNFAQDSKKEPGARPPRIVSLTLEDLKTKSYSHLAREVSVERFWPGYIESGKSFLSKQYGEEFVDSIYADSRYIYFLRYAQGPIDFYKVLRGDLDGVNISTIDGYLIRKRFLDERIPKLDREKAERIIENCITYKDDRSAFIYSYNKSKKIVEIKYRWKVVCGLKYHINKTYSANFYIFNNSLGD